MDRSRIAGLILAGGRARRFDGGRKDLALLEGRPLIDHVIDRARPQVSALAISRAENVEHAGIAIIRDRYPQSGPLAGVQAGLLWARNLAPQAEFLASFSCDTPLVPFDLVETLWRALKNAGASAAIAAAGDARHPTLALWSTDLEPLARQRLEAGQRSLLGFADAAAAVAVDFGEASSAAFANVNTRADLAGISARLAAGPRK